MLKKAAKLAKAKAAASAAAERDRAQAAEISFRSPVARVLLQEVGRGAHAGLVREVAKAVVAECGPEGVSASAMAAILTDKHHMQNRAFRVRVRLPRPLYF